METLSSRFSVAGLDVALSLLSQDGCESERALPGYYELYPATAANPHVSLTVEQIPDFTDGRMRGPEYPGFARRMVGPGEIALSRFDAEGVLRVPDDVTEPIRGQFRVGASENSLEAIIRIAMSIALPRRGGLLMHASAIEVAGEAHIFAGVSGAGKSTIATMLAESWPRCTKLSDELLIVAPGSDPALDGGRSPDPAMAVYVTPFIGSHGLPHGRQVRARALYFLHQAPHHERRAMSPTDGLRELLRHVLVYVAEPDTAGCVLGAAAQLIRDVGCHQLHFAKDPGVASVLAVT